MSLDMEVVMEEYITEAEFQTLMEEILEKLKNHQITEETNSAMSSAVPIASKVMKAVKTEYTK